MISLDQINGEIAAIEEERPTHVSMQKLAALYTVRDHLVMGFQPPSPVVVTTEVLPSVGDSEFLEKIAGKGTTPVMEVVNELVETIRLLDTNLYNSFMRKLP